MSIENNRFEHVFYEIQMYLASYDSYTENIAQKQYLINLLLDSRAIHLRNLAYFFKKEKLGEYWNVCDFVCDTNSINLIDDSLFNDIKTFTSRATCHLLDYRLDESYKQNTSKCLNITFPVMINAINSFLNELEVGIKPELANEFNDPTIQGVFKSIKGELLLLSANKKTLNTVTTSE